MANLISLGTNPYKLGSPPDFGTLYSGRALEFDGVSDYLQVSTVDNTEIGMTTTSGNTSSQDNRTVAVWIKPAESGTFAAIQHIFYASAGGGADGYGLLLSNSGVLIMEVDDGTTRHSEVSVIANFDFRQNVWMRIVAVFDAVNSNLTSYVNGIELMNEDTTQWTGDVTPQGNIVIGAHATSATFPYNGQMSDFQVWNEVWSLSDVQYDYTHPEKLITDNSAVTSGTTISNLKLWYPCTEGNPRSPQTTVYDGSPKELGSECIANGDFTGDVSLWNQTDGNWSIDETNNYASYADSSDGSILQTDGNNLVSIGASNIYKIQFTISSGSGDARVHFYSYNGSQTLAAEGTYADGSHTLYVTSPSDYSGGVSIRGKSAGSAYNITDVSIKEVKMGNHGTTTFYETIVEDDCADNGTGDWSKDGSATLGFDGENNHYELAIDSGNQYCVMGSLSFVDGRTYQIQVDLKDGTAEPTDVRLEFRDGGGDQQSGDIDTTDSFVTNTLTVVATNTTSTGHAGFRVISDLSNNNFEFKNFSCKEVGVASGWTTADAEPLIPQTALMGMSKPMVMDGIDDVVTCGSGISEAHSAQTTWSAWVNCVDNGSPSIQGIIGNGSVSNNTHRLQISANKFQYLYGNNSATAKNISSDANVTENALNHVLVTRSVSEGDTTIKMYVNGALQSDTDTSTYTLNTNGDNDVILGWVNSTRYFNGIINEVAVWNEALTLAEIQAIFNDGVALDVSSDSGDYASSGDLVGYWRNDGASTWSNKVLTSNVVTINEGTEYSDSDVTLTVNNGALVSVNDVLVIEEEQLLITAISTHDLTVVRGYNRTTASAHDDGTNISVYHNGTITGSPDTILLPEGTTSGKDILGFPLTNPNNGWLNLHRPTSTDATVGSYVKIPDNDVLDFGTGDFTIQCWVRPDSIGSGHSDLVGSHEELPRLYLHDNITPKFVVDSAGGTAAAAASLIDLTVGTWYMITGVLDKTNGNIEIWENITKRRTSTTNVSAQGAVTQTNDWYIGNQNGSSFHFDGSIDEVRIYKKALSEPEITKNYKHGLSKHS